MCSLGPGPLAVSAEYAGPYELEDGGSRLCFVDKLVWGGRSTHCASGRSP